MASTLPPASLANPVTIVPFDSLVGQTNDGATFRYLNRESTPGQEDNHAAKIAALEAAHARLGLSATFVAGRFTGSGMLDILHRFFRNLDKSVLKSTYFEWLGNEIRTGLNDTPPGKPLYIVFCTKSRLMRPAAFTVTDPATWEYTDADHEIFGRWLRHYFSERTADIAFALLHVGTSAEDRGYEASLGMKHTGNMGGRPRAVDKRQLRTEAIVLAGRMNATEIHRLFTDEFRWSPVALRTIQYWLKRAGIATKRGRPPGSKKCATFVDGKHIEHQPTTCFQRAGAD